MGIIDFFRGKGEGNEERLRATARQLLHAILVKESALERWEGLFRKAERSPAIGDPREIRAHITRIEIEKLDLERALEQIDRKIILEERRRIEKAA